MKKISLVIIAIMMLTGVCEARRNRKSNVQYTYTNYIKIDNKTAQGVANTMALKNCVSHFGGHYNTYEGCGSGWTQEGAYNRCCYSNSGMTTVDVGYAQSKNGMWYCCRRYSK